MVSAEDEGSTEDGEQGWMADALTQIGIQGETFAPHVLNMLEDDYTYEDVENYLLTVADGLQISRFMERLRSRRGDAPTLDPKLDAGSNTPASGSLHDGAPSVPSQRDVVDISDAMAASSISNPAESSSAAGCARVGGAGTAAIKGGGGGESGSGAGGASGGGEQLPRAATTTPVQSDATATAAKAAALALAQRQSDATAAKAAALALAQRPVRHSEREPGSKKVAPPPDNRGAALNKMKGEWRALQQAKDAKVKTQMAARDKREEEKLRAQNHRLNRTAQAEREEVGRRAAKERDAACKEMARKRKAAKEAAAAAGGRR